MRQHGRTSIVSICAFLTALCAIALPAQAQEAAREREGSGSERGGSERGGFERGGSERGGFERARDGDRRPPPRMSREQRDTGADRFDRGRGFEGRGPNRAEGFQSRRRPRGDRDDAWAELASRVRRIEERQRPADRSRGPQTFGGFGGFGSSQFAGGMSRGGFGAPRGPGLERPPAAPGQANIARELRELNSKLDRLINALERIARR